MIARWRWGRLRCCRSPTRRIATGAPMRAPMFRRARCRPISIGNMVSSNSSGATQPTDSSSYDKRLCAHAQLAVRAEVGFQKIRRCRFAFVDPTQSDTYRRSQQLIKFGEEISMAVVEQASSDDPAQVKTRPGWARANWGLVLAFAVLLAILLLPTPSALPVAGQRMLAVFGFAVIVWITDALD